MSNKKPVKIRRIRLCTSAPFTASHFMLETIGVDGDTYFPGKKIGLAFDTDDRFIRVEIGDWVGLVPLSNVSMIMLDGVA